MSLGRVTELSWIERRRPSHGSRRPQLIATRVALSTDDGPRQVTQRIGASGDARRLPHALSRSATHRQLSPQTSNLVEHDRKRLTCVEPTVSNTTDQHTDRPRLQQHAPESENRREPDIAAH